MVLPSMRNISSRIPARVANATYVLLTLLLLLSSVLVSQSSDVGASSHREAPLIARDPLADSTDLYAFVSPDKPDTVTLIGSWIPFEGPQGGPYYYSFADASFAMAIRPNRCFMDATPVSCSPLTLPPA